MCTVESNLSPVLGEFAPHFPVKYCHNYKVIRHQKNNVVKIQLWTIGEYTAYLWNLIMKKTQASLTLKESHTYDPKVSLLIELTELADHTPIYHSSQTTYRSSQQGIYTT